MTSAITEPPALTISDVATLLQLTERSVRNFIARGIIPAAKLGSTDQAEWRIPRSALDPWLGPWTPPTEPAEPTRRSRPHAAEGGLSRENLRAKAGLDPEPGPSQTFPSADAVSDAPTGTVPPEHPESPRQVVQLTGIMRLPDTHPSETYLPAAERRDRARTRAALAAAQSSDADLPRRPLVHAGKRPAHPTDPTSLGAGPGDDDPETAT